MDHGLGWAVGSRGAAFGARQDRSSTGQPGSRSRSPWEKSFIGSLEKARKAAEAPLRRSAMASSSERFRAAMRHGRQSLDKLNPLLLGPDWCFHDWSETTGHSFEPILQPEHATSLSDLCNGSAETFVKRSRTADEISDDSALDLAPFDRPGSLEVLLQVLLSVKEPNVQCSCGATLLPRGMKTVVKPRPVLTAGQQLASPHGTWQTTGCWS